MLRNAITIALMCLLSPAANAAPFHEMIDVFMAGQEGVHTYRIPGVVVTGKGTILAFCEARKLSEHDGSPTDLVLRRSLDGGRTWQPMQTLVSGGIRYLRLPTPDVKVEAFMDPCPLVDRSDGTIWLSYTQYLNRKMGVNMLLRSTDDGVTWSKPADIGASFGGGFGAGPGMGLQLRYNQDHKGRLVFPGRGHYDPRTVGSFIIYSDDHGKTWRKGQCVPGNKGGECQAIELTDGSLAMNIRSGHNGCRAVALSKDGGRTWSDAYDETQLPEYGCQASILRYTDALQGDRNRILFSNPNTTEPDRIRMTVRLSYDEGKTWPVSKLIHPGPSAYSNLAVAQDGTILCFFEGGQAHRREWIRLARFNLEWLTEGKDALPSPRSRFGN
jgi:sialidase-1